MMSCDNSYKSFLQDFSNVHVNDGFMDGDGEKMLSYFMNLQRSSLVEVKELKERGNSLFRQNHFDGAAACYDKACKILGLSIGDIERENVEVVAELAISLNSNLASCALKLEEFQVALELCSMILDFFPRNVKALFRRALAFLNLKKFSKAELDLIEALGVEPKNKDVLRELDVVKGHLLMKSNGKRVLEATSKVGGSKIKKSTHVSESSVSFKDHKSVITEVAEAQGIHDMESDKSFMENKSVKRDMANAQYNYGTNSGSNLMKNEHVCNNSILEFSNKGRGNSRLRIPVQSYQKLLKSEKVSFYNARDLSFMTLRILNNETLKEKVITRENIKKENRKRCSRKRKSKRKSKRMVDTSKGTSLLDKNHYNSFGPELSCASSICDNFSSPSSKFSQLLTNDDIQGSSLHIPPVTNNASSFCTQDQAPNDYQPFLFSARREKCKKNPTSFDKLCRYPLNHLKKDERRIDYSKKSHSYGDESPRHSLSTFHIGRSFSRKFLRPRGVSVSCRRYSSVARLIKKRKGIAAQLDFCDRPTKKSTLSISTIPSLFSYSNNVIIKPNCVNQVCTV